MLSIEISSITQFNSIVFVIFMTIVFFLYWKIPNQFRSVLLLIASFIFYATCGLGYFLLLVTIIVCSYLAGRLIPCCSENKTKKIVVAIIAALIVGILVFYKYLVPLYQNTIILPLGISFYSFKAISYVIDVYREGAAENNIGKYALYVSFFPEIASGPIDRYSHLLNEISRAHIFSYEKATYGLKRIAWGCFKKFVVADTLAHYVNKIYDAQLGTYQGFTLLLISLFFSIQIYCDFSGYSDMAVGLGKLLDIDLMENFRSPYFVDTIKEFWHRWHISLSTWLRDYIYIPLGGNLRGGARKNLNFIITFLVSGLWHGTGITFLIWGLLHAIAQIIESHWNRHGSAQMSGNKFSFMSKIIRTIITFLFINGAWIFFRASSLRQSIYFFVHMLDGIQQPLNYVASAQSELIIDKFEFGKLAFIILLVFIFDFASLKRDVIASIAKLSTPIRWILYCVFVYIFILFLPTAQGTEFLYFQF